MTHQYDRGHSPVHRGKKVPTLVLERTANSVFSFLPGYNSDFVFILEFSLYFYTPALSATPMATFGLAISWLVVVTCFGSSITVEGSVVVLGYGSYPLIQEGMLPPPSASQFSNPAMLQGAPTSNGNPNAQNGTGIFISACYSSRFVI